MRNIIIIMILIFSIHAHAGWFCEEGSSDKTGNIISACGVGVGSDENSARVKAFENAQFEYKQLCEASDDCRYHFVNIKPKRTECSHTSVGFRCYRMLSYEIGEPSPEKEASKYFVHRHIRTMGESYPGLY